MGGQQSWGLFADTKKWEVTWLSERGGGDTNGEYSEFINPTFRRFPKQENRAEQVEVYCMQG